MPALTTKDLWEASKGAAAESHPADADYVPPASTVKLPSRGIVYPTASALFMCESVDIKSVTAKEENILSSTVLIKKGIVLTSLMRACITNRLIDPDQMLVGDRNAILVSIRVSAYGPKYAARVTCPGCGESHENEFDLSRLSLKTLDEPPIGGPGTNEFSFKLPKSGKTVTFKLMDAASNSQLDKDMDAVKKKTGQEQAVTMRLLAQVLSLQGSEPKNIARDLQNLAAQDSRSLRLHMDSIAPGVDMEQEYECPGCGKSQEVEIPIGTEFFWPS